MTSPDRSASSVLPPGIDLVILDFDGVVADSEVLSLDTLQATLVTYGISLDPDEVRARFLGASLATIAAYVETQSPGRSSDGFRWAWQDRLFAEFRRNLQPMPRITEALDWLRRAGIEFCVASSSSFERLEVALDATGLTGQFAHVFSAEQVSNGKPAPDLFLFAAQKMRRDPSVCLVIEDSPYGIQAARSAGMRAYGFVGGQHVQARRKEHEALLSEHGAERLLWGFDDLIDAKARR